MIKKCFLGVLFCMLCLSAFWGYSTDKTKEKIKTMINKDGLSIIMPFDNSWFCGFLCKDSDGVLYVYMENPGKQTSVTIYKEALAEPIDDWELKQVIEEASIVSDKIDTNGYRVLKIFNTKNTYRLFRITDDDLMLVKTPRENWYLLSVEYKERSLLF